jgi:putative FmdB family regulatory protein
MKTLPLYAYRCTQCGHSFEKIQHFRSKPELVCPKCHGVLERPLTAPAFKFKGAGWYVNDYAGKSAAPATTPAPAPAKAPCGGSCGAACPAVAAASSAEAK